MKFFVIFFIFLCSFSAEAKWHKSSSVDPMSDSKNQSIVLYSSTGESLSLNCYEGKFWIATDWDEYFSGSTENVEARFDMELVQDRDWHAEGVTKILFHPQPMWFLSDLYDAKTLILRASPYGQARSVIRFKLKGLKKAVEHLKCIDWKAWKAKRVDMAKVDALLSSVLQDASVSAPQPSR